MSQEAGLSLSLSCVVVTLFIFYIRFHIPVSCLLSGGSWKLGSLGKNGVVVP